LLLLYLDGSSRFA